MRAALGVICAAVLALPPAAAAPAPTATPPPTATPQIGILTLPADDQTDDGILQPGELPPEGNPAPAAPCPQDGADADYAYCGGCTDESADADYTYCASSGGGTKTKSR